VKFQTTNGHEVEIDDADASLVNDYTWGAYQSHGVFFVVSCAWRHGANPRVRLNRLLTGAKTGELVDHRDGNGLNNTRKNLRVCTTAQNAKNRGKRKGKYRFKGIWPNGDGTWAAIIKGRRIGKYSSDEDAALAYDRAAETEFGEFARLNFPERKDVPVSLAFVARGARKTSRLWGRVVEPAAVKRPRGRPRKFGVPSSQLALFPV
jgi:hypothetical protein